MDTVQKKLLTPADVARQLRVHRETVMRYCRNKEIECFAIRRGKKTTFRLTKEMVEKFLQKRFQKVAEWHR